MKNNSLDELLVRLHSELEQTTDVDQEEQQMLEQLMADISGLLEQHDEGNEESSQLFTERLQEAINQFEISHPTLTWSMGQVLAVLSGAGI